MSPGEGVGDERGPLCKASDKDTGRAPLGDWAAFPRNVRHTSQMSQMMRRKHVSCCMSQKSHHRYRLWTMRYWSTDAGSSPVRNGEIRQKTLFGIMLLRPWFLITATGPRIEALVSLIFLVWLVVKTCRSKRTLSQEKLLACQARAG